MTAGGGGGSVGEGLREIQNQKRVNFVTLEIIFYFIILYNNDNFNFNIITLLTV